MKKTKNDIILELRKHLHICKVSDCYEEVYMIPDIEQPYQKCYHACNEGGVTLASVSRPLVPHESSLCYYHLKKHENYFDCRFPLKSSDVINNLGSGGLSKVKTFTQKLSALFNK